MGLMNARILQMIILATPYLVYKIVTSNYDREFWWLAFPTLLTILVSMVIPRCKCLFRYIAPVIIFTTAYYYYIELERITLSNKLNTAEMWEIFIISMPLIKFYKIVVQELSDILYVAASTIRRYNLIKLSIYLIICIGHSILLVILCNLIAIYFSWIVHNMEGFLHTSHIYREARLPGRKLPEYHKLRSRHDRIHSFEFVDHLDDSIIFKQGSFVEVNENKRLPLCMKGVYRVPGEDVGFSCRTTIRQISFESDNGNYLSKIPFSDTKFEWRIQNKKIRNTTRIILKKDCDKRKSECFSRIEIKNVRPHEFDKEITLWTHFWITSNSTKMLLKLKLGLFFIYKEKYRSTYAHIPEGFIAVIDKSIVHLHTDPEDIVIHQQINSFSNATELDISNACLEGYVGCSPIVSFIQNLTGIVKAFNTLYIYPNPYYRRDRHTFKSSHCICGAAFGIHTFSVQRYLYDFKTGKYFITELELPYNIIILPAGLTQFSDQSYQELRKDVTELLSANEDWKRSWRFFKNDNLNSFIWNTLQKFAIFCIHFDLIMSPIVVIKIYNYMFIRPFAKFLLQIEKSDKQAATLEEATLGNFHDTQETVNDLMIVNTVEDDMFVHTHIVPVIVRRGIIFITSNNYANPGQLEIQTFAEAVASSRNFIIVASEDFINDRLYNDCVFSRFIVPRIYTNEIPGHILVIVVDDIDIPDTVQMNNRVLRWLRHQSLENNTRSLNQELDFILSNRHNPSLSYLNMRGIRR